MSDPDDAIDLGFNPYASPRASTSPGQVRIKSNGIYRSAHLRGVWAMALLGVMIFLDVAGMYNDSVQYAALDRAAHGLAIDMATARADDLRYNTTVAATTVMYFITSVPFLMWMFRAYQNLPALGATNLEHTAGMAVGWWFVPLANFVKPFTAITEIWRNSDPNGIGLYASRSSTALAGFWWTAYLVRNIGGYLLRLQSSNAMDHMGLQELITLTAFDMAFHAVSIAAAILAMLVIRRINTMQDARFEATQNPIPVAEIV